MPKPDFDPECWLDTLSALMDVDIAAGDRAGVVVNLAVAAQMAELLMAFELPDDLEAAPHFAP